MSTGGGGPHGWSVPVTTSVENRHVAFTDEYTIVTTWVDGKDVVVRISAKTGKVE